jgi:hypothetical protein
MASTRELELFILEFGLQISDNGHGRPTSLPDLLNQAKAKLGDVDPARMISALTALNPRHASLIHFVGRGYPVTFEKVKKYRNPSPMKFFESNFNVKVLPEGERRIEDLRAELAPQAPAFSSQVVIGHMERSAFINASPGASISQKFDIGSEDFVEFVKELREMMTGMALTNAQRTDTDAQFVVLDSELKSATPRSGVIKSALQSLRTIFENAAGSLIGNVLYAKLHNYIISLSS